MRKFDHLRLREVNSVFKFVIDGSERRLPGLVSPTQAKVSSRPEIDFIAARRGARMEMVVK